MSKLYKYFSSGVLDLVLQRPGYVAIKFSYPKDYNDPFELFLGVDLTISSDALAVYQDIVQQLPQFPTTCFSKSPVVTPMWAHYGANHTGVVLEFDVEALKETFQKAQISDVNYKDQPDEAISASVYRAAGTKKPRHAVWLRQTVFHEAYFSKQTVWSYEQESRMIDFNDYVEEVSGNQVLFIPLNCLSSVIVGRNFPEDRVAATKELARAGKLAWYRSEIGKTYHQPFLISEAGEVFQFQDATIRRAENICGSCSEPTQIEQFLCPWCSISEDDQLEAARGNPFRILDHYGLLENYFEEVGKIERRK